MDLKTRRTIGIESLDSSFDVVINISNRPATLSIDAINRVGDAVRTALGGDNVLVLVDGEEDLLAIPAVLMAPRGSVILYGLYTGYLIAIPIINEYKLAFMKLLLMMPPAK
ncbi:DUF359 domain-containing protein [Vulcanisaeta souniana]|nr:DUF359 domain-containing protein [Vulcanisaeta souniana]